VLSRAEVIEWVGRRNEELAAISKQAPPTEVPDGETEVHLSALAFLTCLISLVFLVSLVSLTASMIHLVPQVLGSITVKADSINQRVAARVGLKRPLDAIRPSRSIKLPSDISPTKTRIVRNTAVTSLRYRCNIAVTSMLHAHSTKKKCLLLIPHFERCWCWAAPVPVSLWCCGS
jgi:hypothetical protein